MQYDRKFNVFVSSTFRDLKEERKQVILKLLDNGFMVSYMENFNASELEQFKYIQKVIGLCDYFVLIIGGKYGSINETANMSYTELEFDYAGGQEIPGFVVEEFKGIPRYVFYHSDPLSLPPDKREQDKDKQKLFEKFLVKAIDHRMAKTWTNSEDLSSSVLKSIINATIQEPREGWIKGDILSQYIKNTEEKEKIKWASINLTHIKHDVKIDFIKQNGMQGTDTIHVYPKEFWHVLYSYLVDGVNIDDLIKILNTKIVERKTQHLNVIKIEHPLDSPIFDNDFHKLLERKMKMEQIYIKLTELGRKEIAKFLGLTEY